MVDTIKHADISGYLFDAIFIKLEEIDPELALTGLIQILQDGSPWMRVYAAQRVRHHSDARAVHALSEWQVFLGNEFVDESPTGPRCGREPSEELRDGSYWCSWCGDEFTLGAAWAARQRKANE